MAWFEKAIPIGIENFSEMIQKNYYYVDKTLMIRDLLDRKGKVNLFTRPRRFGKTLNLSMLRYFFEDAMSEKENMARRSLFDGLKIAEAGEEYQKMQCGFPVITLTLKSAKQGEFEVAYGCLVQAINAQLTGTISFMDSAENFYHGFMVGLLRQNHRYMVKSNRESGNSRGDIFIYPPNPNERAYILEMKAAKTFHDLKESSETAVRQIVEKNYAEDLFEMSFTEIELYGIAFYRKNCRVFYGGKAKY